MNDIISIIVPIYNSSKTLDRCIRSVLCQTYKNIELLLINDGSTDSSEKICLKYQKKDSRVKYYYKENSGAGDTRNYGIKKATGDYIGFIDSDDEVLPNMYEKLICANIDGAYDVIGCSNFDFDVEQNINRNRILNLEPGLQGEKIIFDILYQNKSAWGAVWNKIFKKEVLKNIYFPKTSIMEDYLITIQVFDNYSVYLVKEPLYIHYNYPTSLSHTTNYSRLLEGYDVIKAIKDYFIKKHKEKRFLVGCDYMRLSLSESICHSIFKEKSMKNISIVKKILKKEKIISFFEYKTFSSLKLLIRIRLYYFLLSLRKVDKNESK